MKRRVFSALLGVGLVSLALSMSSAQAGTVLVFGQVGIGHDFKATTTGAMGSAGGTHLAATDIKVIITGIDNSSPLPGTFPNAFFTLSADSTSNATSTTDGQNFMGSFSIRQTTGGGPINYLSGTFTGALVSGSGGSLTFSVSGAGVPSFTSDVITNLLDPRAVSLSFTNVSPGASINAAKHTFRAFTSNVSGNMSAAAVPEPASLALLGIGMTGFLASRRFFKKTSVA